MTLQPVQPGELAAVVTYLEMRTRPRSQPLQPMPFRLQRWVAPDRDRYRALFRRIGAPWLWFSRLAMPDEALDAIIADPLIEIYALSDRHGVETGMVELDFRVSGCCEIAYFGLIPELTGKGLGRWLMQHALGLAWRKHVTLVQVHSCTLDHPKALNFYRNAGFVAVRQAVETFADPRLIGLLPEECAPQIPLLRADSR
jgi:GNAT superfamily N-acetyltransferase